MKATENKTEMTLQSVMEQHPRLSLKRICDEAKLCYQYLLKAGKQPIAGQAYDPTATNYAAMDAIIKKRGVDLSAFDWDSIEATIQIVEPINKPEDFTVGTEFKLRGDTTVFTTVFTTETHIVFMARFGTQPRVMSWDTFQHQSPRITDRVVEEEEAQA